jgi:tetratricopeptide (TPR) repeat protein
MPEMIPNQEWLEYSIHPIKSNSATLSLNWEKMRAGVTVEVDTTPTFIMNKVKAQVGANTDDATLLNQAARYALTSKQNLDEAMTWAQKSVSNKKMYANLRTVAELYAQSGKTDDAIKTGEEAIKVGKEQDPKLNTSSFEKMIEDWKSKK